MKTTTKFLPAALALGLLAGCAMNDAGKGTVIGGGLGGTLGGLIGHHYGNTAAGIIIGAAVGGAAGASIGHYMDKQAEELRNDLKDARVERVGEGIKITFNSGILFDIDSDRLRPDAQENLGRMAKVLNKYEDTKVVIQGHTDSTGTKSHNQKLSEERARSVADYLKEKSVSGGRMDTEGFGETQPVADNGTASGRQANRRVEVAIFADEKLKRAAKEGKI